MTQESTSSLVQKCRELENSGNQGALTELRKKIVDEYLPQADFYLNWSNALCNEDVSSLQLYLESVIKTFPDFQLLNYGLNDAIARNDKDLLSNEELQQIFENVIKVCGFDLFSGIEFWRKYREFLIDEYEDYLDRVVEEVKETKVPADINTVKKAKQNFIKVFHRQFSIPLVGNEQTLEELDSILSKYCVESDIDIIQPQVLQTKFHNSEKQKVSRLTYELYLHSEEYSALTSTFDQWKAWKTYIEYEKEVKEMSRAQRLYERAIISCCLGQPLLPATAPVSSKTITNEHVQEEIWLEYCEFVLCQLKNSSFAMSSVLPRALKHCPRSLWLRKCYLFSIASHFVSEFSVNLSIIASYANDILKEKDSGIGEIVGTNTFLMLRNAYSKTMEAGFSQSEDYLQYQFTFCNIYRLLLYHLFSTMSNNSLTAATAGNIEINLNSADSKAFEKRVILQTITEEFKISLQQYEVLLKSYYSEYVTRWYEYVKYFHRIYKTVIVPIETWLENTRSEQCEYSPQIVTCSSATLKQMQIQQKQQTSTLFKMWEDMINSCTASQGQSFYWLWKEMITAFQQHGDHDTVRNIYKKLIVHYTFQDAGRDAVLKDYIHQEEEYGTNLTNSVFNMLSKILPHILEQLKKSSSASNALSHAVNGSKTVENKEILIIEASDELKRPINDISSDSTVSQKIQTQESSAQETKEPPKKRKRVGFSVNDGEVEGVNSTVGFPNSFTNDATSTNSSTNHSKESDAKQTYFIKNIPFHTTFDVFF